MRSSGKTRRSRLHAADWPSQPIRKTAWTSPCRLAISSFTPAAGARRSKPVAARFSIAARKWTLADFAIDSSPEAQEFAKLYAAVAKIPADNYSSWTYDAIGVLSAAINKAGSTDPDKIRAAILATKGYKGAEGEYNFDEFGDGLHGYNIVRNEKGVIVFDKHIEFTD